MLKMYYTSLSFCFAKYKIVNAQETEMCENSELLIELNVSAIRGTKKKKKKKKRKEIGYVAILRTRGAHENRFSK